MAVTEQEAGVVRCAGIRWRLAPGAEPTLPPSALDLAVHLRTGNAQVVKSGPHRTVYRVALPGGVVFWKHCRIAGLRSWLRQCIRPPKARMEYDRAVLLASRGIHTIEPLAWGTEERAFAGQSYLITREIAGAKSLSAFLDRIAAPAERRAAANALGQFLARLHDAGVVHPDLHTGNILVVDNDREPRFFLIDVHDLQIGQTLSWRARRDNLVVFNRWFVSYASRPDRLRFWHAYCATSGSVVADPGVAARDIELRTVESNVAFRGGRDRRCLGTNRYFQKVRSPVASGHAVRDIDREFLNVMLNDPDAPFRAAGSVVLKDSRTTTVAEIDVPTADGTQRMIWKRFRVKKPLTSLINRLRPSPALRSWQAGYAFLNRQLPTPRPWLVLHRRGLLGPGEGYLLCDKVTDAVDLIRGLEQFRTPRAKWNAIAALARLLREMHDLRLSHRDLKAANILWQAGSATFHFIDLVGVSKWRRLSNAVRIRNLARLQVSVALNSHLTRTDRLRFLSIYLCWALRGQANWKDWWRRIAGASREKIERNQARGRPVA